RLLSRDQRRLRLHALHRDGQLTGGGASSGAVFRRRRTGDLDRHRERPTRGWLAFARGCGMTVSTSEATPRSRPTQKKRRYSDGHPLDHVQYVESKIILKGDRFTSVESFDDFARL